MHITRQDGTGPRGAHVEQHVEYADEIDLREYIEVLWRGKWVIVIVTLCAMLSAAGVSFFLLDPVYESSVVLTVSLPEQVQGDLGDPVIANVIGGTPQAHARLIESPAVLQRATGVLAAQNVRTSPRALRGMISAKVVGDTAKGDKLIEITARDKTPEGAKAVADAVASGYLAFLSDLVSTRLSSLRETLGAELAHRSADLENATKELSAFMAKSGGQRLIEQEIDAKTVLLANYKGENARLKVEAKAVAESLRVLESHLKNTPEKLSIKKSFSDALIVTSKLEPGAAILTTEELNPAYPDLITQVALKKATLAELDARMKAGNDAVAALSAELEALEAALVESAIQEQNLRERLEVAQSRYIEIATQLQSLAGREPHAMVRSAVDIVAPASLPVEPSGPRKLLNIATAGVLGVMVSVFVVFIMHYWRSTQPMPGPQQPIAGRST